MKYEVCVSLDIRDYIDVEADSKEEAAEYAKEIFRDCFESSDWYKEVEAEIVGEDDET